MKFLWCDTETTGLEIYNAAPFEIGFIFVSTQEVNGKQKKDETEKVYNLNPFDIPGIEYNEESGKIHGYTKDKIESFEKSSIIVKKITDFLEDCTNFYKNEKLFFCGYNANFDWKHLVSLFNHHNLDFTKYFYPQILDVYEQVKKASSKKILPYLPNRKLVTIADYLHINLDNAHEALSDIKATREVAKSLAKKGISLS